MLHFLVEWIVLFILFLFCVAMSVLVISNYAKLKGRDTLSGADTFLCYTILFVLYSILQYAFF